MQPLGERPRATRPELPTWVVGLADESVEGVLLGPAPHAEAAEAFCEHWVPQEVEDFLCWPARPDAVDKPAHLRAHCQVLLSSEHVVGQIQNLRSLLSLYRHLLNGAERMSKQVGGRHGSEAVEHFARSLREVRGLARGASQIKSCESNGHET